MVVVEEEVRGLVTVRPTMEAQHENLGWLHIEDHVHLVCSVFWWSVIVRVTVCHVCSFHRSKEKCTELTMN